MTTAIFGLVGVIIGGVLNAVVTRWLEEKRALASARAAARLVRLELMLIGGYAAASVNTNIYGAEAESLRFDVKSWQQTSAVLAAGLNDDEWGPVMARVRLCWTSRDGDPDDESAAHRPRPTAPD
jgi:hypothetical protein